MPRLSRSAFADALAGLDEERFVAFVADCWRARGDEVTVDGTLVIATGDGHTQRLRAVRDAADATGSDCDAVVTSQADAPETLADGTAVIDAGELHGLVLYGIDPDACAGLFAEYLDRPPRVQRDDDSVTPRPDDAGSGDGERLPDRTDARPRADYERGRPDSVDVSGVGARTGAGRTGEPDPHPESDSEPASNGTRPRAGVRKRPPSTHARTAADGADAAATGSGWLRGVGTAAIALVLIAAAVVAAVGPPIDGDRSDEPADDLAGTVDAQTTADASGTESTDAAGSAPPPGTYARAAGAGRPVIGGGRSGGSDLEGNTSLAQRANGRTPPGVDGGGITDAERLADAHADSLTGQSYRWELVYREHVDGRLEGVTRETVRVAAPQTYVTSVRTAGELQTTSNAVADVEAYANGSVRFERDRDSGGVTYRAKPTRIRTGGEGYHADRAERYLGWFLSVRESRIVDAFTRQGTTYLWIVLDGDPWPGVENLTGSALVDEHGKVHEVYRRYNPPTRPDVTVEVTLTYSGITSTTVAPPEWLPAAKNATGHATNATGDGNGTAADSDTPTPDDEPDAAEEDATPTPDSARVAEPADLEHVAPG